MTENNERDEVFSTLDKILSSTNIEDLNADSKIFEELKDGYYLCEVEGAELKVNKNGLPMVSVKMKTVDLGYEVDMSPTGDVTLITIPKSKGRFIYIHFVLTDETSVKKFVTNMLKFEGEVEGEPILPKEAFISSETLEESLEVLEGCRIYVQVETTIKADGSKSTWNNLISWKRAKALELPM